MNMSELKNDIQDLEEILATDPKPECLDGQTVRVLTDILNQKKAEVEEKQT